MVRRQLDGVDGGEASAYLEKRGITRADHAASSESDLRRTPAGKLKAALKNLGEDKLIETAVLLIQPEEGGKDSYDRFRGRLMIPIRDQRGRVIGFGGRILGAGEPKYLNSPETVAVRQGPHALQHRPGRPGQPRRRSG